MHVRLSTAALLLVTLLTASGCGSGDDTSIPPLTPEPTISLPPADPATVRQSYPARVVLYRYLRGIAAGDPRACGVLAPAYAREAFGTAGCATGLARLRRQAAAADLTALRGVTVPSAEAGPGQGEFTVGFADLQWRTDPPTPGELIAESYVIRRTGTRWLIVA